MTDFLFYGETGHSAAMRHELPIAILDPFLLGIVEGRMHVMASPLEAGRIAAAAPAAVLHDFATLGLAELFDRGLAWHELDLELASRAAAAMGVREAVVRSGHAGLGGGQAPGRRDRASSRPRGHRLAAAGEVGSRTQPASGARRSPPRPACMPRPPSCARPPRKESI